MVTNNAEMAARMNRILNKPNQDAKAVLVSLKNIIYLSIIKTTSVERLPAAFGRHNLRTTSKNKSCIFLILFTVHQSHMNKYQNSAESTFFFYWKLMGTGKMRHYVSVKSAAFLAKCDGFFVFIAREMATSNKYVNIYLGFIS